VPQVAEEVTVVKRYFEEDGVRIKGFLVEGEDGSRGYVNVVTDFDFDFDSMARDTKQYSDPLLRQDARST
jgi:hypothetical protein